MTTPSPTSRAGAATPNQVVGYVFGVVYLLVGSVGFLVTRGVDFAATEGKNLIFFEINPLHNVVHLLIGAALLLAASRGAAASRGMNMLVGVVYAVVGILGFFIHSTDANILALNGADHLLHLATAAVLVIVASSGRSSAPTASVS